MNATFNPIVFLVLMTVYAFGTIGVIHIAIFKRHILAKLVVRPKLIIAITVIWLAFLTMGVYLSWGAGIAAIIAMVLLDAYVSKPLVKVCTKAVVEGQLSLYEEFAKAAKDEAAEEAQPSVKALHEVLDKLPEGFPKEVS